MPLSTIVEIIRAYQPGKQGELYVESTIVEIIRAYQPKYSEEDNFLYLQQQKLLELTSLRTFATVIPLSTIVEIIRAYQPEPTTERTLYLQQQKLLELTSPSDSL